MGSYALISSPSLWALLPLVVYLIMVFRGYRNVAAAIGGLVVAFIMTGQSPASCGKLLAAGIGSFLGIIGIIIMLGSGLGIVMTNARVSHTIVSWIVKIIGVNTKKKAILAVMICSTLICGLLGTLAGGNAIIAPILIPVVAAVGLTPSTMGPLLQVSGETGLIWGPFSPPVVALLGITGLTYGKMMLWAALPFGIVWLITLYFTAMRIQKNTESWDKYEDVDLNEVSVFVPTSQDKRATYITLIGFAALITYGMVTQQGTNYVLFVMIFMALLTGLSARMKLQDIIESMAKGMGQMTELFLLFVILDPLLALITTGGGFVALSNVLMGVIQGGGKVFVMLAGTIVGSFGIEGSAVGEMKITHELFLPAVKAVGLPMEMWAIALIADSRITANVYPTANMIGQMGIARSKNLKAMLIAGWATSITAILYIVFWAFIGNAIFF